MHKLITYVCCLSLLLIFAACSAEEGLDDGGRTDGMASVRLSLSAPRFGVTGPATRAVTADAEAYGEGEQMRNAFVVVVQDDKVIDIIDDLTSYNGKTTEDNDFYKSKVDIAPGATTFYAFANLQPADIGLDATATMPYAPTGGAAAYFAQKTIGISGNKDRAADFANGIPMYGKKEMEILATTSRVDIDAWSMVAKVRLQLTNVTEAGITVNSVSLTDITDDAAGTAPANLYLVPTATGDENTAGDAVFTPRLTADATHSTRTVSLATPVSVAAGATETVEFYVNESEAVKPKYFVLSINTNTGTQRYAMLTWDKIARNDLRVIPVRLDDYVLSFRVEAFTPIGLLPSVTTEDGGLSVDFKTYGEFHIIPTLTRISTGEKMTLGTDWSIKQFTTDDSTIYDTAPTVDAKTGYIEGEMGITTGTSLHEFQYTVGSETTVRTARIQISMDGSDYAARRRAAQNAQNAPCLWQICPAE